MKIMKNKRTNKINTNSGSDMAVGGKFSMELNFTRNIGKSRRAKMKSFWEFIEQQKELIPLRPSQEFDESNQSTTPSKPSICQGQRSNLCGENCDRESLDPDNYSADGFSKSESPTRRNKERIWYNKLRVLKDLGLDRVALASSDACKLCLREEKNTDNDLQYADSVPQPYEELAAELKEFQNRVANQKPKCVYQTPGKYEHLVQ